VSPRENPGERNHDKGREKVMPTKGGDVGQKNTDSVRRDREGKKLREKVGRQAKSPLTKGPGQILNRGGGGEKRKAGGIRGMERKKKDHNQHTHNIPSVCRGTKKEKGRGGPRARSLGGDHEGGGSEGRVRGKRKLYHLYSSLGGP